MKELGRFITRYDVSYTTEQGHEKIYEMISRNNSIKTLEDLNNPAVEAVVLVMFDEKCERVLLNREFRLTPGCYVIRAVFEAGSARSPVETSRARNETSGYFFCASSRAAAKR